MLLNHALNAVGVLLLLLLLLLSSDEDDEDNDGDDGDCCSFACLPVMVSRHNLVFF